MNYKSKSEEEKLIDKFKARISCLKQKVFKDWHLRVIQHDSFFDSFSNIKHSALFENYILYLEKPDKDEVWKTHDKVIKGLFRELLFTVKIGPEEVNIIFEKKLKYKIEK